LSNYLNKINNESAATAKEKEKEATAISLLKTLEDMLRNKIQKKEDEVHKIKNIAENDCV
jgi:hypothetical protein